MVSTRRQRKALPPAEDAPWWRVPVALGLASVCALLSLAVEPSNPGRTAGIDQLWAGAQAIRWGIDPYEYVGPGRAFEWEWPLYYPLPALLAFVPLSFLPLAEARAVWVGITSALFFFVLLRDGASRIGVLLSLPFLHAIYLAHTSFLTAAAAVLPQLGFVAALKPNLGAAVTLADPSARRLLNLGIVGGSLLLASFLVQPGWIVNWLGALWDAPHFVAPVLRPGGFLLLLAVLRWRRWEARLLLAFALVPFTSAAYEMLILFLIPNRHIEALSLAALSWVIWFLLWPQPDFISGVNAFGRTSVWLLFLPCLVMVLLRPNEGEIPDWLDRLGTRASRAAGAVVRRCNRA